MRVIKNINSANFFLLAYAREACCATPVNKGLLGVSFVRFFVFLCKRNKKKLSTK